MNHFTSVFALLAFIAALHCPHIHCQVVGNPPPAPLPPPEPLPPTPPSGGGIPFPPFYHNAPKGPSGYWRNFVNIETGSNWGTKSCRQADTTTTSTTTAAPYYEYPPAGK